MKIKLNTMKLFLISIALLFASIHAVEDGTCDSPKSSCAGPSKPKSDVPPKHFNVILIGATGNLASKYLWRSLFEVFRSRFSKTQVRFQIYGSARKETDEGRKFVSRLLLSLITCESDDEACREMKKSFVEAVQYNRLKTERDFKDLGEMINENTQNVYGLSGSPVTFEEGRLIYMSIPPSTYTKTSKYVHMYLRPKFNKPWFRVVLEKPFGHDLDSALKLSKELSEYFSENELYRVDHYLGKTIVKQILPFRYRNKAEYEPMWNKDYIEQVEVVMKEKDDVAGRTDFYNEVGIIRDVVQNHLTEMFALVAMNLPENSGNISAILEAKVKVLHQVRQLDLDSTLIGQYSTYNSEWMKNEEKNFSKVPTFSSTVLFVDNERWRGVPFLLMSGKKLEEKASYVRIKFRNAQHCMRATDEACTWQKQIVFNVGGTNLRFPAMISTSRGLPSPRYGAGWSELTAKKAKKSDQVSSFFGQTMTEMNSYIPDVEYDPYTELISAVIDGERTLFTPTEMLLASWKLWTPLIHQLEGVMPRQYLGRGKDSEKLDFVVTRSGIRWQLDDRHKVSFDSFSGKEDMSNVLSTFRTFPLVSGSFHSTLKQLSENISSEISSYQSQGKDFHLALSGGKGGIAILKYLAHAVESWSGVHIWLVDERCVSLSEEQSNFNLIQKHLLSRISAIPHWNVHPMPVHLRNALCDAEHSYNGATMYEDSIRQFIPDVRWDYVVLGVGEDGHTASLFPDVKLDDSAADKLVVFTETSSDQASGISRRMSLTYKSINTARRIAVLVLGSSKHNIVETLEDSADETLYPILRVKPVDGHLTWYIDNDALQGAST